MSRMLGVSQKGNVHGWDVQTKSTSIRSPLLVLHDASCSASTSEGVQHSLVNHFFVIFISTMSGLQNSEALRTLAASPRAERL